jgi:hypothetical protein
MRSGHPYRAPPDPGASVAVASELFDDGSLGVLSLFWMATAVRVAMVVLRHEPMAIEPSLALVVLIGLPWIARASFARRIAKLLRSTVSSCADATTLVRHHTAGRLGWRASLRKARAPAVARPVRSGGDERDRT